MKYFVPVLVSLLFCACRDDDKESESADTVNFPANAFILAQVRDVDTSLYNIIKIVQANGHSDTTTIPREQFRKEAAPFIALPDISSKKLRGDYTETKLFDESLNKVVLFYTAKDPETDFQREQILIDPDIGSGVVKTIIADIYESSNGGGIHRNLLWETNSHFQVSESRPGPGGTERIVRTIVIWNNFSRSH
jgi:hypothetical protein